MCGGVASALGASIAGRSASHRFLLVLSVHLGRIVSYGVVGALAGSIGWAVNTSLGEWGSWLLMGLSTVMLLAMAGYISGVWMGLQRLERALSIVNARIAPLRNRLLPIRRLHHGWLIGALWGWIPCGLVYSTLSLALTAGHPLYSGSVMVAFGLGTMPMVLGASVMSAQMQQWMAHVWVRRLAAVMLVVMAVAMWVTMGPWGGDGHQHHHHHH